MADASEQKDRRSVIDMITRSTQIDAEVIEAIEDLFSYHRWTAVEIEAGTEVRTALANAVKVIIANVPPCPTRTVAMRKIFEARMDCNAAITHSGRF